MRFTGAEIIIKLLERQGISIITGIPGGSNLPLYDALGKSGIKHVLARHEQGAGFIAQGMSRSTGRPAVCFATSGPGATNLITAIADAKMDSVPIIAITGQVPLPMIGTDAFQEVDIYGLTVPITKHNYMVRSAKELLSVIPEAFEVAASGRPGPVLIDVPKDVQLEALEIECWPEAGKAVKCPHPDPETISKAAELINASERPVLYIGGGTVNSDAQRQIRKLAETNSIPVVSTLMGLGVFDMRSLLYLGMLGMHGTSHANFVLDRADLLIAIGARFDDRATGRVDEFCRHASIIHIDIDGSEIDKIKKTNCSIMADAAAALDMLLPIIKAKKRTEWIEEIFRIRGGNISGSYIESDIFNPVKLISLIGEEAGDDTIVTTDVGQHQMWTAQEYPFSRPRQFLTSGGLGTMGFGIPAAIGAALMHPDKKVICFTGDGSILMNIQELATISEQELNLKVIIFNNGYLGLVRQQQELFYNGNYSASHFQLRPDFPRIAAGFGIRSCCLNESDDPIETIRVELSRRGPSLIDVQIHPAENVYPMVPPGAPNREMISGGMK